MVRPTAQNVNIYHVSAQGTVGASGDLAPLSHLAQGVIGEGRMWSPKTGWGEAMEVLASNDITPYQIKAKDGVSLINGTQFICAVGAVFGHFLFIGYFLFF